MHQTSQAIAERYRIALTPQWAKWFDRDAQRLAFAGEFRAAADASSLLEQAPTAIWPGLMLPDTLPILGNDYGDWICVRANESDHFGELLHWYHGGGDWIPLGEQLAEAVLHDAVDQFRPRSRQVLRGAPEITSPDHQADVLQRFTAPALREWLIDSLADPQVDAHHQNSADSDLAATAKHLDSIIDAVAQHKHAEAIERMLERGWARAASICDRVELALQDSTHSLAHPEIPKQLGINWEPDYVRWLFDTAQIPRDALQHIQEILHATGLDGVRLDGSPATNTENLAVVEPQDWGTAERLANAILAERADLGWAFDIAGWAALRRGDSCKAAELFFRGRHASAFSDQSVRMRTHWFDQQFGKFTIAQLWAIREQLNQTDREDTYLQTIWQTPSRIVQREVQGYWMSRGREAMRDGRFADAYSCFYHAGWDLGAQRMTDYLDILAALVESAEAAGWKSRALVAATHLACLSKVMPI